MSDDVQLPDLEVIGRYSLAVRAATAPREEVIAALQADLAWLTAERTTARRARPTAADTPATTTATRTATRTAAPARRRRTPRTSAE